MASCLPRGLRLYVTPIIPKPDPPPAAGGICCHRSDMTQARAAAWPQVMRHRHPPRGIEPAAASSSSRARRPGPWRPLQLGETPASIVRPVPGQFAVGGQQQGGVAAIAGVRDHRRQQRRAQPAPLLRQGDRHLQQEQRPIHGFGQREPARLAVGLGHHSSPAACAWRRTSAGKVSPSTAQRMGAGETRGGRALDGGKAGNIGKKSGRTVMGHRVCRKARPPAGADGAGRPAAAAHPHNHRLPAPAAASTRIHP